MAPELIAAGILVAALVIYLLGGGADFGGGFWDLLASGPRAQTQRDLIESEIGPIWEANHVWFIFVFTVLFTGFPPAFAAITIALFFPLTAYAIGIVVRGAAFTFRHYDPAPTRTRSWGLLFGFGSIICPFLLGLMGAALVTENAMTTAVWTPFTVNSGLFVIAQVAALAASYLTVAAKTPDLARDFRLRALGALLVAGLLAFVSLWMARSAAPGLYDQFASNPIPLALASTAGAGALIAFKLKRDRWGRACTAALTMAVVIAWAWAKSPMLVAPNFTLANSKAHDGTLRFLIWATVLGGLLLFPSIALLFRIFKSGQKKSAND